MENIIIRPTQDHEHKAVVALQIEGWQTAYRGIIHDKYLDKISHEDRLIGRLSFIYEKGIFSYVAVLDDQIIGMCDFGRPRHREFGNGEIFALYVSSKFKSKGVGKMLIQKAIETLFEEKMDPIYLLALEKNQPARQFYEKIGFKYVGDKITTIAGINYPEVVYQCKI